jgi:hypothetical protein
VRKRLGVLIGWSGHHLRDGSYVAAMDDAFDAEEMERERLLCHVYLARYMRTSPEEVERMPTRRRDHYLRLLSGVIKAESKPSTEDT